MNIYLYLYLYLYIYISKASPRSDRIEAPPSFVPGCLFHRLLTELGSLMSDV